MTRHLYFVFDGAQMYSLLFANIHHACTENDLRDWIAAHGVRASHIRLISDTVSRTSPSFAQVQLLNEDETDQAARALDGQQLNSRIVRVKALTLTEVSRPTYFVA